MEKKKKETGSADDVQIEPTPFEGLEVRVNDATYKFSEAASLLVLKANEFTWKTGLLHVGERELFSMLFGDDAYIGGSIAGRVLRKCKADFQLARMLIYHNTPLPSPGAEKHSINAIRFDSKACDVIKRAEDEAKKDRDGIKYICTHHILLVMFSDNEKLKGFMWSPNRILRRALELTPDAVKNEARKVIGQMRIEHESSKQVCLRFSNVVLESVGGKPRGG